MFNTMLKYSSSKLNAPQAPQAGDSGYAQDQEVTSSFSGLPPNTTVWRKADGSFMMSQNIDGRRDIRAPLTLRPDGSVAVGKAENFDGGSIGKTLGEFGLLAGGAFAGLGALGAGPLAGMFGAGAGGAGAAAGEGLSIGLPTAGEVAGAAGGISGGAGGLTAGGAAGGAGAVGGAGALGGAAGGAGAVGGAAGGAGALGGAGAVGGAAGGSMLPSWLKPNLISGGVNLLNGYLGNKAADKAADAQVRSAQEANALAKQMWEQTRADNLPALQARNQGLAGYQGLLKDPSSITKNPGYKFGLTQGVNALDQSATARGMRLSGGQAKALTRYGQDYGMGQYDNALQRYGNLAQLGATGTQTIANAGNSYSQQAGGNITGAGNARAGGIVGGYNALSGGVNNFLRAYQENETLRRMGYGG